MIITNDAIFETTETFHLVAMTMQERVVIVNGMIDIVIYDDGEWWEEEEEEEKEEEEEEEEEEK